AIAPDPQLDAALDDRLNARLAQIQSAASRPSMGSVPSAAPALWGAAPATVTGNGSGGGPISLHRGGSVGGAPLELARGSGGHGIAPALAPVPDRVEREPATPGKAGDATARRSLAGATLMGPIADRPVRIHVTPTYPEWAKREGVEGS